MVKARIVASDEIHAAWIQIKTDVEKKKRGEDIEDAWIQAKTGVVATRVEERIRRFFRSFKIDVQRKGDKLHILTHAEQADNAAAGQRKTTRGHIRTFMSAKGVDRGVLPGGEARKVDLIQRQELVHLDACETNRKEHKELLGAPAPRPLPPRANDISQLEHAWER